MMMISIKKQQLNNTTLSKPTLGANIKNNSFESSNSTTTTTNHINSINLSKISSNSSSNETVIAKSINDEDELDNFNKENKLFTSNNQELEKNSSSINGIEVEASDQNEFKLENDENHHLNEDYDNNNNSKQRKFFKNFLFFTTFLKNPFHNNQQQAATLNGNDLINQEKQKQRASVEQILLSSSSSAAAAAAAAAEVSPIKIDNENKQHHQRSTFHLNLLNFAQKYFGNKNNNNNTDYYSKSAPVTPIKSLNQINFSMPNGQHSSTIEINNNNNNTAGGSNCVVNEETTNNKSKPSVRFVELPNVNEVEEANYHDDGGGGGSFRVNRKQLKYSDCASQTINNYGNYSNFNTNDDDEQDQASLDGIDLVSRLFKLPENDNNNKLSGEVPMNSEKFRQHGYSLIDYISNYLDTINKRRVTPLNIEPGYLKSLIQPSAPEFGESFSKIMKDFEAHIMCGITHWQHPHFHAYFPAGNAYPSILADMLSDALGCVGFSWAASPAYTELEIIMLDWMGKMIGLPDDFLCLSGGDGGGGGNNNEDQSKSSTSSKGGGVIQGSASECVLVNLLAARHWAIDKLRLKYPNLDDGQLLSKLIGYCSKEAHSCVEKAAMIGFIRMRALDTDDKHSLRGEKLELAIKEDLQKGLEPFFVCATLGTTSCVSFDNLEELGLVCKKYENIWLHVDAAYAGSALICPEFQYLIKGIDFVTSINMNPNKWMLINFDCSLMWVKDRFKLTRAFVVDPLYLQHSYSDQAIDYRHWGIPLSRRFRALKLWFVIRNYGLFGLQSYIRNHVRLAKLFKSLIENDKRFSIMNQVVLGLVCFRLIGSNALNQRLLSIINGSGKLHMVPASLNGRYVIRFCVCDQNAKDEDIYYAYQCISEFATELLESIKMGRERIRAISQQNTIDISSVSIHTQQSVSADPLEKTNNSNSNNIRRLSTTSSILNQQDNLCLSNTNEQNATELLSSSLNNQIIKNNNSTLVKQTSFGVNNNNNNNLETDEDLEQSIRLDYMNGGDLILEGDDLDEEDYDDDDDLLLNHHIESSSNKLDNFEDQTIAAAAAAAASGGIGNISTDSSSILKNNREKNVNKNGNSETSDVGGEAADEVYNLTKRRNRMSLRYKREFFVRVVSDPRVYRASISGDINNNARASTTSLSGSNQQQQSVTTTTSTTSTSNSLVGSQQINNSTTNNTDEIGNINSTTATGVNGNNNVDVSYVIKKNNNNNNNNNEIISNSLDQSSR